jgi:hypothetical protein
VKPWQEDIPIDGNRKFPCGETEVSSLLGLIRKDYGDEGNTDRIERLHQIAKEGDLAATAALGRILHEGGPDIRAMAARALRGVPGREPILLLGKTLGEDGYPTVRLKAVASLDQLAWVSPKEVAPYLVAALWGRNPLIREQAVTILCRLGPVARDALVGFGPQAQAVLPLLRAKLVEAQAALPALEARLEAAQQYAAALRGLYEAAQSTTGTGGGPTESEE